MTVVDTAVPGPDGATRWRATAVAVRVPTAAMSVQSVIARLQSARSLRLFEDAARVEAGTGGAGAGAPDEPPSPNQRHQHYLKTLRGGVFLGRRVTFTSNRANVRRAEAEQHMARGSVILEVDHEHEVVTAQLWKQARRPPS
jgi:hypothetical protein